MLLGETSNIVAYGFVPSEAMEYLIPLYEGVHRRSLEQANDVSIVYTDTCCSGCGEEKLMLHILACIFEKVERAPFLDLMHFIARMTKEMDQQHKQLVLVVCSALLCSLPSLTKTISTDSS